MPRRATGGRVAWPLCLLAVFLAMAAGPAAEVGTPPARTLQDGLELPGHRGLMAAIAAAGGTPAPFTTDGCSGGLSSGWSLVSQTLPGVQAVQEARPPWEACCVTHDRAYHDASGARSVETSFAARLAADEALRACVVTAGEARAISLAQQGALTEPLVRGAYSALAEAMFTAVRLGGGPCSGLPWRWGYGYPDCAPALR